MKSYSPMTNQWICNKEINLDSLIRVSIFFTVVCIYILTLSPSVSGGDSGELITVAYSWGVAHPPGFPLYTLLAKLFTFLPFGSVAWRVNLFSAFCDALAAVLVYQIIREHTQSVRAGLLASIVFSFSTIIWAYAVVAEVFALNNLIIAILVLILVRIEKTATVGQLRWFFFWCGISLTNQYLAIFVVLPSVAWLLFMHRASIHAKSFASFTLMFLLGISPYIYIPVASKFSTSPSIWGEAANISGFLIHLLRSEYGTFQLAHGSPSDGSGFWNYLWRYFVAEFRDTSGLCILAALSGAVFYRSMVSCLMITSMTLYIVVFFSLSNLSLDEPIFQTVMARFYQQPHLLMSILAGLGFHVMTTRMSLLRYLSWGIPAFFTVFQLGSHFMKMDQSQNYVFRNFALSVIHGLPENSILIGSGDFVINPIRYIQQVEGVRSDVPVLDLDGLASRWYNRRIKKTFPSIRVPEPGVYHPTGGYQLREFLNLNADRFTVFGCNGIRKNWDQSTQFSHHIVPVGLLEKAIPLEKKYSFSDLIRESEKLSGFDPKQSDEFPVESWEYRVSDLYWAFKAYQISYLFNQLELSQWTDKVQYNEIVHYLIHEAGLVIQSHWTDKKEIQKVEGVYKQLSEHL